ncbi:BLUF domain-containing protein [Hymenobacter busanensis]|uniref:BLUF domain-containing protein n=1 Tax=Hymenobacter busanensis TaxID=2607656 RepID=A0A7L4ZTT6_9BACT|nr:BLUF domain-containing protein [Hymenobacter busanensis]KAA9339428.1 BLUF domain-containing protein [Hymenobacter busanensis]QHJ06814.1 hypothetical protein GUY19_05685 [Hymenobacter busanensis]
MTASTLYHLVYQSTVTKPLHEPDLQALLTQSRAWNTAHGLTGVLLYSDGDILQVLEGSEAEVQYIFARIFRDVRHQHVVKLADGPIEHRLFSAWSMGFAAVAPEKYRSLAGYVDPHSQEYGLHDADAAPDSLHEVLSTFVHHETIRL